MPTSSKPLTVAISVYINVSVCLSVSDRDADKERKGRCLDFTQDDSGQSLDFFFSLSSLSYEEILNHKHLN